LISHVMRKPFDPNYNMPTMNASEVMVPLMIPADMAEQIRKTLDLLRQSYADTPERQDLRTAYTAYTSGMLPGNR